MQNQNARIYVGGIFNTVSSEKFDEIFGKYGKIIEIKRNKNFSFVQYADESGAQAAISGENGKHYFGRNIDVQIAKQSNREGGSNDKESVGGHRGGPPGVYPGGPFGGSFDDKRDQGYRDGSPGGFRGGRMSGGPPDDRFDGNFGGPPGFDRHHGPPGGFDHGPGGFNGPPGGPRGGPSFGPLRGARPFDEGFREGPGGFGGPPRGDRFGGPGPGNNFRGNMMDGPVEPHPPTQPPGPLAVPHENRTNDVEIIVINKSITDYGEFIEQKLKASAFTVDLLFPNEEVPLRRVLANIASRGTLYAILVTPLHRGKRSLTLNILHGAPQEHRNILVEDAITLISRNYEMYVMQTAEKRGDIPPEDIRNLLQQFMRGRPLTVPQLDKLIMFFTQEKSRADPIDGPPQSQPPLMGPGSNSNQPPMVQPSKGTSLQEAELQNRILNILNKGGSSAPQNQPPMVIPGPPNPPPGSQKPPLLNDPSVQKALDNLMQGFNPNNRMRR